MKRIDLTIIFLVVTFYNLGNSFSSNDSTREMNLFKEIRCLVCQSQTIHESNSELAEDIKLLIREKISEGKTDDEIKQFLVDKYGEWVLMTPRFNEYTYLLWGAPLIIFIFGFLFLLNKVRRLKENKE
jgi:cytochrome c-type biogenesis protein CcmH